MDNLTRSYGCGATSRPTERALDCPDEEALSLCTSLEPESPPFV